MAEFERPPAGASPRWRRFNALGYDPQRARTVMFGGWGFNGLLNDTWEWDSTSWARRTPATVPPQLAEHAMIYYPARQLVVLFGGMQPGANPALSRISADTWEWNGTDWSLRSPSLRLSPDSGTCSVTTR